METVSIVLQAVGSLGFILYGMKLMSDGIQKSTGESLHKILNFMAGNRFLAVLTGFAVTAIVQSSGATTIMTVSFVNAGMLTLQQAIGIIFGANIGTTVTAWIVALIGFQLNLAIIAIPAFGIGYFLTFFKKLKQESLGESIMGFGLLFAGLDFLSSLMPSLSADNLTFLSIASKSGFASIFVGFIAGFILTVILHSSSATTSIVITMAYSNVIGIDFAAASVLGSNIGSTVDAVLAATGSKLNARRAAAVHVLFNVFGAILFLALFYPALDLLYFITPPKSGLDNITTRLALFHSLFNLINTIIALPFVNQIAKFVEWLIKPKKDDTPEKYQIIFKHPAIKGNNEAYIFRGELGIVKMSTHVQSMLDLIKEMLENEPKTDFEQIVKNLAEKEDYADQMQEELSRYLIQISRLSLTSKAEHNVRMMLRIVDDLENITDQLYEIGLHINKSVQKKMSIKQKDMEKLLPYFGIVNRFMHFVHDHLNKRLAPNQLALAHEMEDTIDAKRTDLKKLARKRLEDGADVRSELLYLDIVRSIEKIGDYAFNISESLAKTR
ncbi:Na/Pi cotransporter family protein [Treponema phagedenis]|uniref:Na/Pi cotransporter family protein n=1 Tax=Treponema phagedenis TaxID=162 RepID=UPI0011F027EA|nr:Na/Pi cotransporter family protein [Treponema phagedenis]TYT79605.1 Na/Pi cotransporter family protein [Treponema phagedenis]